MENQNRYNNQNNQSYQNEYPNDYNEPFDRLLELNSQLGYISTIIAELYDVWTDRRQLKVLTELRMWIKEHRTLVEAVDIAEKEKNKVANNGNNDGPSSRNMTITVELPENDQNTLPFLYEEPKDEEIPFESWTETQPQFTSQSTPQSDNRSGKQTGESTGKTTNKTAGQKETTPVFRELHGHREGYHQSGGNFQR